MTYRPTDDIWAKSFSVMGTNANRIVQIKRALKLAEETFMINYCCTLYEVESQII